MQSQRGSSCTRPRPPGAPLLLIADETTAEARAILGERGIPVVDGLGNVHIKSPGLILHLEGHRRPRQSRPARRSFKAVLIAQALLLDRAAVGRSRVLPRGLKVRAHAATAEAGGYREQHAHDPAERGAEGRDCSILAAGSVSPPSSLRSPQIP